MKKIYLTIFLLISQISLILSQTKLVYWYGTNTSTAVYPRSGLGLSSKLTSANENYSGLNTNADNRNVWNTTNTSTSVDPNTAPYLSYELVLNTSIQFDRFVLGGVSKFNNSKLQLRWSVDNYGSSLGEFDPIDGNYHLTSVNLSSTSVVTAGNLQFRIYFYNDTDLVFNPGYYSYTSLDGTPSLYGGGSGQAVSIWADPALSIGSFKEINMKLFPNPATEYIKIHGLKSLEKYSIYNILGTKLTEGTISSDREINIKNLDKGVYFIFIDNSVNLKFIKQ